MGDEGIVLLAKDGSLVRHYLRALSKSKGAVFGAAVIAILTVVAVLAPFLAPYHPNHMTPAKRLQPPSPAHYFGTDGFGRDVFSRVFYGTRVSLGVGVCVVTITTVVGVMLGLLAGFYGVVDNVVMRILDGMMAFPAIILQIAIMAALGARFINVVVALAIVYSPRMARVVRSAVLVQKEQQYIEAAKSMGASDLRIIMVHILPNCVAPIIIQATMIFAYAVLSEASLSFLGVGVPPEIPSWGNILEEGRTFIRRAPWMISFPGLVIVVCVLALNLLGDGLRDILDPKIRKKQN
ncbi:MAG TPA: ABC transporter permease [Firmicutes bacterium]|jgi:peptide/nickel transport system permease protein|nr:ABC transporter permease [Bacillota bacterium]